MSKILISGLCNLESTVNVRDFPVEYSPIEYPFNQVGLGVGGVGFNLTKALRTLGDDVTLLSYLSHDLAGKAILRELNDIGVSDERIIFECNETPLSVVLYDETGKRKIYCDLKDVQEKSYPIDQVDFRGYDAAILANANFTRPLLSKAKQQGCLIVTDVQAIQDINDVYNQDFMAYADVLFFSNVAIEGREESFVREVHARFQNRLICVGMGEQGALLYFGDEDRFHFEPVKHVRPVVSTVGAGDSLLSCFTHYLLKGKPAEEALRLATYFAAYKIGEKSASDGFLRESELENL